MKTRLTQRLKELQSEYESGQKMLMDLENQRENLNQTLLRISGAVQVLQEEINNFSEPGDEIETLSNEQIESATVQAVNS